MIEPARPSLEATRLEILHSLQILDTPPDERFDRITRLAARLLQVPIAVMSLVDADRQWFKSAVGVAASEAPRAVSFCGHAILDDDVMLVPDATRDPRFHDNPFVTAPDGLRFYAGYPLTVADGVRLGTLCIADTRPRELAAAELALLQDLGRIVEQQLVSMRLATVLAADLAAARSAADEAEQRWQFAVESSEFGVWDWDAVAQKVWFSPRWKSMLGYAEQDIGDTLAEWESRVHPDDLLAVMAALTPHMEGHTPFYESTHRLRCKDGSYKWIHDRGKVIVRALDGQPMRAVGTHTDVTHHRIAEQVQRARLAAEEASRAKSEFLSRVSHELRTPLNAVIGFGQLLQLAPHGLGADQRGFVDRICEAGQHLLAMVDDLLDIARIESERLQLDLRSVRLKAEADQAVALLAQSAAAMDVGMVVAVDPALCVQADPTRLRQVLMNLLSNAIKFNRRGGVVTVTAHRARPGRCAIAVIDTGRGMRPDQLEQLFQPFNRLGADALKIKGTGIGLVVSQRLTQAMDGELSISSQPDLGTVATVVLPAAPAQSAGEEPAPPLAAAA